MQVQPPILCAGDWHALGEAQGAALAPRIAQIYDILHKVEAFALNKPWWLPFSWFRALSASKAHAALAGPFRGLASDVTRRLDGIARGAKLSEPALYLIHFLEVALASVESETPPAGCSALGVRGRRTASGEAILVHNFDYLPIVQPFYCLRDSRPRGGFRSLDFLVAPMCGAVDGINDQGLAIVYNYAQTRDRQTIGPTVSMRVAEVLAHCSTVSQALDWLTTKPRWGGGLLLLADAQGELAALELTTTKHAVRQPDDDCLYNTNCFLCSPTQEVEVSHQAIYTQGAPGPLRGLRVLESSEVRNERFRELLVEQALFDEQRLTALMADHGPEGKPSGKSICMHSDYWTTTASLQLFPRSRRLRAAYDTTCQASHVEFAM